MEIQTYLDILWRRKWLVVAAAIIGIGIALAITYVATPIYTSSITLRIATIGGDAVGGRTDIGYTERLMNTYAEIITGGQARSELRNQFNLVERPVISADLIPGTELMKVQVKAEDPTVAYNVANAAADLIIQQNNEQSNGNGLARQDILDQRREEVEVELQNARAEYDQLLNEIPNDLGKLDALRQSIELKERIYATLLEQYEAARINDALRANSVIVVEPAFTPDSPSSPRTDLNLALGLLVGLFVGVALAFLAENLDSTLHTREQIEAITHSPTIGEIPAARGNLQVVHGNNGHKPQFEAFRRLRINVLAPLVELPAQVILVTSAESGEGKTTIVANLAVTMAQSGRHVVVVDCNLHQPTLHKLFQLENKSGLTNVLMGQASVAGVLQKTDTPRLKIVTSGPALSTADGQLEATALMPQGLIDQLSQGTELLGSPNMVSILTKLKEEFDVVLLDTPGMLTVTDAAVLVPLVDEVLVVVARERSKRNALRLVRQQLTSVKAKSVGVVMNRSVVSTKQAT